MGDRRVGDRRDRENGVIRIKFKDAVKYIIVGIILIISIAANIVLATKLKQYKSMTELYLYDEIVDEDSEEEIDINELMDTINSTSTNTAE